MDIFGREKFITGTLTCKIFTRNLVDNYDTIKYFEIDIDSTTT